MTDTAPITSAGPTTDHAAEGASSCASAEEAGTTFVATADGPGSTIATYNVTGMTCEHCVRAVSTEIRRLPGVTGVVVDLSSGAVTVMSAAPLANGDFAAAVDEAGYELVAGENVAGPGR